MKPITEEQKQTLIAACEEEISRLKELAEQHEFLCNDYLLEETNNAILRQEIALASLTAEPEYNTSEEGGEINLEVSKSEYDKCHPDYRWISYTAPPVSVIKFPEIPEGELVFSTISDTFGEDGCMMITKYELDEFISGIKHLNNLE